MSLEITDLHLDEGEYFKNETEKDAICLHHTAGGHRPDWTVKSWNRDRSKGGSRIRVGTHYVIGGLSTRDKNDTKWDGKIYRCIDEKYWAHHLGIKAYNNTHLNKKTFGIEICNYGYLTPNKDGEFFTYVNSKVPEDQVVELSAPFQKHIYYQKYTDAQLEATRKLMIYLRDTYGVNIKAGLPELLKASVDEIPEDLDTMGKQKWLNSKGYVGRNGKTLTEDGVWGRNTKFALDNYTSERDPFALSALALDGAPGVWTHTNYRKDKYDCSPQPQLLELLKSF